ncbi:GH92 family glycosyl hydrolase [Pedobacter faecalis]|uniref:GH92 family glycosyl hydrolase n=1 Tax=Pedobacter faecalis TaxID=3041495 RepID=UPI002551557A|nr:GH92 family glycosyl hydrolase [Pedobacter sp. ELA7]
MNLTYLRSLFSAARNIFVMALLFFPMLSFGQKQVRLTNYVNPLLGTTVLTDSALLGYNPPWRTWNGLTGPGATVPHGMVQVVPVTTYGSGSGYEYEVNTIKAIAQTSGNHWGDLNIPVMPLEGTDFTADDFASVYSHSTEVARPGYYEVVLERYKVKAQLTATKRAAYHKYTYTGGQAKKLAFDLVRAGGGSSTWELSRAGDYAVTGRQGNLYFYAVMNHKIKSIDAHKRNPNQPEIPRSGQGAGGQRKLTGNLDVTVITFENSNRPLELKITLSRVSPEGAKANYDAEIANKDFDQVYSEADKTWEQLLGKIKVTGGTEKQKSMFYSCLYRQFCYPSITSDADGKTGGLVQSNPGFETYASPALWDVFRTQLPVLDLIEPEVSNNVIRSMILNGERSGFLPTSFHGDFASTYIAGAYARGIRDYDVKEAYRLMLNNANTPTGEGVRGPRPHNGQYLKLGYLPEADIKNPTTETVSTAGTTKTLEFAYSDYSIAQLAKALGDNDTYNIMMKRSQNYRNVFDAQTGFMRGRLADGKWVSPFDPGYPYYEFMYREANAWQASFFVPQDTKGLISLYQSPRDFELKIDSLFSVPWGGYAKDNLSVFLGQFCMGNQPDFGYPYLYYFVNKPEKSQAILNKLMSDYFGMGPEGLALAGMDDYGSLTGWYVLNAMGIYPYSPADPEYIVSVPIFDKVEMQLGNGKVFTINKRGKGKNISKLTIGGAPLNGWFIKYADLAQGKPLDIFTK